MLSSIEIFCLTSFESLGGLFNMLLFFSQVCVKGISDPSQIDIYAFVSCISVGVERFISTLNAFEADLPNMTENTLNKTFLQLSTLFSSLAKLNNMANELTDHHVMA